MAARPLANPPPVAAVSAPGAAPTVQSLGEQLRELLPSRRLHSVSVWDAEANVLWLSEGALGPDEQTVVLEAFEVLADEPSLPCHENGLEDGRYALYLPVRAPTGHLVGVAMILADCKSVGDDTQERLTVAPVRAIMQRLAVLLKPAGTQKRENGHGNGHAGGSEPADLPDAVMSLLELVPDLQPPPTIPARRNAAAPSAPPPKPAAPPPARAAKPEAITPEEVDDILEFELPDLGPPTAQHLNGSAGHARGDIQSDMVSLEFLPLEPPAPPVVQPAAGAPVVPAAPPARRATPPAHAKRAADPMPAARAPATPPAAVVPAPSGVRRDAVQSAAAAEVAPQSDANLTLEVLPYAKLRPGGQTRRFQIQARLSPRIAQADPAVLDVLILQRLVDWLAGHRAAWNSQPTSFNIGVSIASLEDEHFAQRVAAELNARGIAAGTLGFEITEAVCTQRRAQVERFLSQCDKLGAGVVIDDFSFDTQVLPLLRSKAVRLLKIDPRLSSSALKDKLSQALVIATVQAAKVLGIHCAATRVDTQAAAQWLGAIGCDFGQGAAFPKAKPLESVAASADATGLTTLANRPANPPDNN